MVSKSAPEAASDGSEYPGRLSFWPGPVVYREDCLTPLGYRFPAGSCGPRWLAGRLGLRELDFVLPGRGESWEV